MTFYHLIMHTGCNLSCKYCDRDEFVPFDDTYELCMPDKPEYSLEDLKKFITKEDYVTFYGGGEPLLNIPKIKEIMDNLECKGFMIQTNGILLKDLGEEYVKRLHTILISIDGDEKVTDKNRGKGVHKKVMGTVSWLKTFFSGEVIARMCIAEGSNVYEQVTWLIENGFDNVHWQLDVLFFEEENTEWLENYNSEISKLMSYWISKMKEGKVLSLYPFLVVMDSLLKNEKSSLRCGCGKENLTITTQGKIAPCPIMSEMKKYYMGDLKGLKVKEMNVEEPCSSCEVFDVCGGRCLYSNLTSLWSKDGWNKACGTVKHLIKELENNKELIEDLIEKKIISLDDFKHLKYNGVEVIP